jgi:hypothetical protein
LAEAEAAASDDGEEEQKPILIGSRSAADSTAPTDGNNETTDTVDEPSTPQPSPKKARTSKSPAKPKAGGSDRIKKEGVKKEQGTASSSSSPSKSGGGGGGKITWSQNDKWAVLDRVIQSASPDWEKIAREMGKSRSQVYDQVRCFHRGKSECQWCMKRSGADEMSLGLSCDHQRSGENPSTLS